MKGDTVCVQNIRDLRFMWQVFSRQGKSTECMELWFMNEKPPAMRTLLEKHNDEVLQISFDWEQDVDDTLGIISGIVSQAENTGSASSLDKLSSWNAFLWYDVIRAIDKRRAAKVPVNR